MTEERNDGKAGNAEHQLGMKQCHEANPIKIL